MKWFQDLRSESSPERRRNVYGREWFRWGALTYVRIRLNQVKAKANYYIGRLYILNRISMRIPQVDYGDCAIRPKHGLKQEKAEMRKDGNERRRRWEKCV